MDRNLAICRGFEDLALRIYLRHTLTVNSNPPAKIDGIQHVAA
jgi:hypothetical protein